LLDFWWASPLSREATDDTKMVIIGNKAYVSRDVEAAYAGQ
jgi:hypothetical protein